MPTTITDKRRVVVAILAVLTAFAVLAIWGVREPEVAIAQQTGCTLVDTFAGEGFLETRPFTITSDRWQLTYEVSGLELGVEAGLFITVYSAANDQFVTSTSQEREGINTFAVNAGPGTYYLDVVSVFGSWRVDVEECGGSGGGFPIAGSATTTSPPATASPTSTQSVPGGGQIPTCEQLLSEFESDPETQQASPAERQFGLAFLQAFAQGVLDEGVPGAARLDPDGNGVACDQLLSGGGSGSSPSASAASASAQPPLTGASQSPPPNADLFDAGGPEGGPVPLMPGGGCPSEYPVKRGDACYR
jgi:hypothetical protein